MLRAVQTQLVGRQRELRALHDALDRARQQRAVQLVTLVGEPGIGKSRLVFELMQVVEADPELIRWRQGRSLPYGEGSSFWALAEMVKAEAGILETDSPDEVAAKVHGAVGAVIAEEAEADWVEGHLRALAGIGDEVEPGWSGGGVVRGLAPVLRGSRRANGRWCSSSRICIGRTRACSTSSITWSTGRAGCRSSSSATARPELLERRPGWGGGKPNVHDPGGGAALGRGDARY